MFRAPAGPRVESCAWILLGCRAAAKRGRNGGGSSELGLSASIDGGRQARGGAAPTGHATPAILGGWREAQVHLQFVARRAGKTGRVLPAREREKAQRLVQRDRRHVRGIDAERHLRDARRRARV